MGSALAEAEAHLADSGEPASEAFGTPEAYAQTLLPKSRREGPKTVGGALLCGGAGYLGVTLLVDAATRWGGSVTITLGTVVALVVLALVSVVLTVASGRLFQNMGALTAVVVAAAIGLILPGVLIRTPLGTLPAWTAGLAGTVLLLVGIVYLSRIMRGDPIVDPRRDLALDAAEEALVAGGHRVEAMKHHRERTGSSLVGAKRAVEGAGGTSVE